MTMGATHILLAENQILSNLLIKNSLKSLDLQVLHHYIIRLEREFTAVRTECVNRVRDKFECLFNLNGAILPRFQSDANNAMCIVHTMTLFTDINHIVTLTTQEPKVITTLVKPITSDRSLPWYGCWVFYMMQRSKLSNSGGLTVDIIMRLCCGTSVMSKQLAR